MLGDLKTFHLLHQNPGHYSCYQEEHVWYASSNSAVLFELLTEN
jgi:hypothetical protein